MSSMIIGGLLSVEDDHLFARGVFRLVLTALNIISLHCYLMAPYGRGGAACRDIGRDFIGRLMSA